MRKKLLSFLLVLSLVLTLTGCGHELDSYRPIENIHDLEGRKIGVAMAWAPDYVLSPRDGKDLILYRYDYPAYALIALFYHQIDAVCVDKLQWLVLENTNGDALKRIEEPVSNDGYIAYLSQSNEDVRDEFNRFIEYYHQTEEFADLYGRIMSFDGLSYVPGEFTHPNGQGKKIRLAFCTDNFPYCYSEPDGTIAGFDIEIMRAFADFCDYEIELIETTEEDMFYSVMADRYDMGIGMLSQSYAEEAETSGVLTTDVYYEMPLYLVELKEDEKLTMSEELFEFR